MDVNRRNTSLNTSSVSPARGIVLLFAEKMQLVDDIPRSERMISKIIYALQNNHDRSQRDLFLFGLPTELQMLYSSNMRVTIPKNSLRNIDSLVTDILLEDKKERQKDFSNNIMVLKSMVIFFQIIRTQVEQNNFEAIKTLLPIELIEHIEDTTSEAFYS